MGWLPRGGDTCGEQVQRHLVALNAEIVIVINSSERTIPRPMLPHDIIEAMRALDNPFRGEVLSEPVRLLERRKVYL